jgi:hypothetical protein
LGTPLPQSDARDARLVRVKLTSKGERLAAVLDELVADVTT